MGNPKSRKPESGIGNQNPESGIRNPETTNYRKQVLQICENYFAQLLPVKIRGCKRGKLLTGWSANPTIINRTSLCAPIGRVTTMIGVNRIYWCEAMRWSLRRSLKKNQGFNGIRTRDLRDTGAMLYQLSYEARHWERGQFIEFISPVRSEMMWSIYEIIHIFELRL